MDSYQIFFYINIEFDPLRLLWVVRFPFCTALLEHSQQLLLVVFTLVDAGQQTNKQIDRRRIWNSNVLRFWNSGQMFMIYKSFILKPYTFKEKHLNGTCLEPIMPKKLKINFYVPYFNLSWKSASFCFVWGTKISQYDDFLRPIKVKKKGDRLKNAI